MAISCREVQPSCRGYWHKELFSETRKDCHQEKRSRVNNPVLFENEEWAKQLNYHGNRLDYVQGTQLELE